jgi:hypothetical protein
MGRYIECKIGNEYETVWKYEFGVQDSEMHRISTELGIGEYHMVRHVYDESDKDGGEDVKYEYVSEDYEDHMDVDGDVLILTRSDIEKLEMQIQSLKKADASNADEWFIGMTEAIRDFIIEHSEQDRFVFEGEF